MNNKLDTLLALKAHLSKEYFYHDDRLHILKLDALQEEKHVQFFQTQLDLIEEEIKEQKRIEIIRGGSFEAQLKLGKNG